MKGIKPKISMAETNPIDDAINYIINSLRNSNIATSKTLLDKHYFDLYPNYIQRLMFLSLDVVNTTGVDFYLYLHKTYQVETKLMYEDLSAVATRGILAKFLNLSTPEEFAKVKDVIKWQDYCLDLQVLKFLSQSNYNSFTTEFIRKLERTPSDHQRFLNKYLQISLEHGNIDGFISKFENLKEGKKIMFTEKFKSPIGNEFYFCLDTIMALTKVQIDYFLLSKDYSRVFEGKHILNHCINSGNIEAVEKYKYLINPVDMAYWNKFCNERKYIDKATEIFKIIQRQINQPIKNNQIDVSAPKKKILL